MTTQHTTTGAANTTAAQTTLVAKISVNGREDWWRVKIYNRTAAVLCAYRIRANGTVNTRANKILAGHVVELAGELSHRAARARASILEDCPKEQRAAYAQIWQREHEFAWLDIIVRNHTAFGSFEQLLNAAGNYRPTLDMGHADRVALADAYDHQQSLRGDARRVERYTWPSSNN